MTLPEPVLRDVPRQKLGKQLQQKCCLCTAMAIVYWESGLCLVVDLGKKKACYIPRYLTATEAAGFDVAH